MSSQPSIAEPFLLSSYSIPHKNPLKSQKISHPASLHATFTAKGSSEGYVTVAAQADGVHVLDVSTLHPVISHTLGPTTSFACPAVTCISSSSKSNICTTYAAIASSSATSSSCEVSPGKTIWSWQEDLSSPLAERKQERKSTVVPYLIHGLYACPSELGDKVVVTGEHGEFAVIDSELNTAISHVPNEQNLTLLKTFVSSKKECTFVPAQSSPSKGVVITSIFSSEALDSIRVEVKSLNEDDEIEELGFCELRVNPSHISSLALSHSGCLTIFSQDLSLQSYLLSVPPSSSSTITSRPFPSFALTSLAQSPSLSSILALTSTHVLLASPTASRDEVALLLWDMQYGVLLTSYNFPVPSSMKDSTGISAQLVDAGHGQAVCVLSPLDSRKQQAITTTVLMTSYSVPPTSTIANALGKALNGARWVKKDSSTIATSSYGDEKSKLVADMRSAVDQNRVQAANDIFFAWEKAPVTTVKVDKAVVDGEDGAEDGAEGRAEEEEEEEAKTIETRPDLDYTFVKDVLNIVLQIGKPANAPYSSEVVRYLLENKAVSSAMVEGGILAALRVKNDWKSIETAVESIVDLSEAELITSLYVVLAYHRSKSAKRDENAMEVDQPTNSEMAGDVPSVASFLAMVLNYSTSSVPLRVAIRTQIKQAEDLTTLLDIANSWLGQWNMHPLRLLPSAKELRKNDNGTFIFDDIVFKQKKRDGLPSLANVTNFIEIVLDAAFVTLLTHTPSHKILKQLRARLDAEIERSELFQHLRGPLEPFVQAQAKAVKEAARKKEKGKGQPTVDWRQRRKQAQAQAGLSIGVYQLEELLL